jgi:cell division septation protein DedD
VSRSARHSRLVRIVGGVIGAMVLLLPAGQATADDDPSPVDWPKIEQPDAGGNASDPEPVKWTTVDKPQDNGTASDPKPADWPTPQPPG